MTETRTLAAAYDAWTRRDQAGLRPRCVMPWQSLMIDVAGNVQPCAYRGNYTNTRNAEPLGNINTTPLDAIWNGAVARRVRRRMAAGDLDGAGCGQCLAVAQGHGLGLELDLRACADPPSPYSRNLVQKIEEIEAGRAVCRSRPTVLYFTPDHRCNLACVHCYQNTTRKASVTRKSASEEVLALVPTLSEIIAGGGEPLILPLWRRLLREGAGTNPYMRFATTTNATVLREDVFGQLAQFERLNIVVSMDGATRESFETLRAPAKWDPFLANTRRLRALCSEKAAPFCLNISTMKGNLRELPQFVEWAAELAAPFNYQPVVAYPAAQSLRCFNDPQAEMRGWRAALDGAAALLETRFIPAMREAACEGRALWYDVQEEVMRGHVVALRGLIPWHLDVPAPRCTGRIPARFERLVASEEAINPSHRKGAHGSIILFFPEDAPPLAEPHFYAPLDAERRFAVTLPEGRYRVRTVTVDSALGVAAQAWADVAVVARGGRARFRTPLSVLAAGALGGTAAALRRMPGLRHAVPAPGRTGAQLGRALGAVLRRAAGLARRGG